MASDPQTELRVTRLENDTSSIYDLITDIRSTQQEHSQRFDKMESTFSQRFDKMDSTFSQRFDKMDSTFSQRFDKIESALADIIRRLPDPS